MRFAGRKLTSREVDLAERVLVDFNDKAGTTYKPLTAAGKPTDPFKRILGALDSHPDLTFEQAARVNQVGLARPFWTGPAQPGNVWGPGVVDRNVQEALQRPGHLAPVTALPDENLLRRARRQRDTGGELDNRSRAALQAVGEPTEPIGQAS